MTLPILLLDLDGPVVGFDEGFWGLCADMGWAMDCLLHEQTHRFALDHIIQKEHRNLARQAVETSGWFADLPVNEGAIEGVHDLERHADIWLCTKPLERNPTCRDDKAAWVVKHLGADWERKLIVTPDKSMVRGDVLLDDAPHLDWIGQASWRPVIFTMSWNGAGSQWEDLPHWTWGDPVEDLLNA